MVVDNNIPLRRSRARSKKIAPVTKQLIDQMGLVFGVPETLSRTESKTTNDKPGMKIEGILNPKTAHFVCCLKSNNEQRCGVFDAEVVTQQLTNLVY